ncbi:MAG: NmrA family NAD(P)-binding protein [Desulfobacterales bacterium]|nr:NmrA family NAD(P)-binding protein [Desulfobacterales bacterium]
MLTIMGATGNIGSKLADRLLEKNQRVKVIGRSADRLQPFVDRGATAAVGDAGDSDFLSQAFSGSKAVFAMIPPDYAAQDFRQYQNEIGRQIATAIEKSSVSHAVNLSSHGADLSDKTGPIKGLRDQEQRLNQLDAVDILHLRPTFFMENMLMNIDMIKNMGINGGHIRGDLPFAMIATEDIAEVAAQHLLELNFSGKTVRDLLGPRDISMEEVTRIIGEKIGKPDLPYVHFSREEYINGLLQAGLAKDMAEQLAELDAGINDRLFGSGEPRTQENRTSTDFKQFADFFAQVYQS